MNKKMRELMAQIKAKLEEVNTYTEGETKDLDKAEALMAEVKDTPPYVPFGIRRFSNLCTNKSAPSFLSVARKGMLGTPGVLSGSTLSLPGQLTCVIFCILHILCLSPQERTVTVRSFPLLRYYDLC